MNEAKFKCPCCGKGDIDARIKGKLRMLERLLMSNITITSGYRCENYNREVGGVEDSKHTKGLAVDFYVPTWLGHELRELVAPYFDYVKKFDGNYSWALHCQINE